MSKSQGRLGMTVIALIGGLFLYKLALEMAKPPKVSVVGPTATIRHEVAVIYATERLIEFAKKGPTFDSIEELKSLMKVEGIEGVWYAIVFREFNEHGRVHIRKEFCRLGQHGYNIWRNKDILAVLAGHRPQYPALSYKGVRIATLPEESMNQDPLEIMKDLDEE